MYMEPKSKEELKAAWEEEQSSHMNGFELVENMHGKSKEVSF